MKQRIFRGVVMACSMSICMSFFMTYINIGFIDSFIYLWLRSLCFGLVVALPLTFILPSMIAKLERKINI